MKPGALAVLGVYPHACVWQSTQKCWESPAQAPRRSCLVKSMRATSLLEASRDKGRPRWEIDGIPCLQAIWLGYPSFRLQFQSLCVG